VGAGAGECAKVHVVKCPLCSDLVSIIIVHDNGFIAEFGVPIIGYHAMLEDALLGTHSTWFEVRSLCLRAYVVGRRWL